MASRRRCNRAGVAWAVALVGALAGCGHLEIRVVPLGAQLAALPASAPVQMYRPPLPLMDARELGLVEITSYDGTLTWGELVERLRDIARSMGGNGAVWVRVLRTAGFVRAVGSVLSVNHGQAHPPGH